MSIMYPPTLAEPAIADDTSPEPDRVDGGGRGRWVEWVLLAASIVLFGLHFFHLRADFPNYSPWMDWAKYTDEGWYGDAAIRHFLLGHWNVPGDFNPAAALPMWPLLEMALFRFTGVSLAAARALTVVVFGLILLCTYLLAQRWSGGWDRQHRQVRRGTTSLVPAVTALLLVANPFCYVFTRLAIVEPLLVLLMLLALLSGPRAGELALQAEAADEGGRQRLLKRCWMWSGVLGVLLPMMVLTKTTAIFLFPAVFWMVWASAGYRRRPFLKVATAAFGVGAVLWGLYFGLFVRPHFLLDYQYLFSANGYTKVTLPTLGSTLLDAVREVSWLGVTLFWLSMAAAVVAVGGFFRRGRSNPLVIGLLLWITGYSAFMVYHAAVRTRYYLVIVVPYTLLVTLVFEALVVRAGEFLMRRRSSASARWWNGSVPSFAAAVLLGAALTAAFVLDLRMTLGFVRHPEYTFLNAAEGVNQVILNDAKAHPDHSRMVLSISGSDLSLMTGLRSICDDFGTMELADRVAAYRPGWFATWNDVEDDKMAALAPLFKLQRVAAFRAFDDPERNLLILYRLDPTNSVAPTRRQRRSRARNWQRPSSVQLKH
jgi:hypothetical protein